MQQPPIAFGDDPAALTSPTYPPQQMYDSSLPPPPVARGVYYPSFPQEPPSTFAPEPPSTWAPYNGPDEYVPPPTAQPPWYNPSTAVPSVPYQSGQSTSPYNAQISPYARTAPYPAPEFAPQMPAQAEELPVESTESKEKSAPPKKKRRKDREPSAGSGDGDKEKRIKTGRACDACSESADEDTPPVCAHCKGHKLECTFFLPITETRFKRKKPAAYPSAESPVIRQGEVPGRIEGPTSLSFLINTSLPAAASEAYDLRYHHTWEVTEDGDGLIRIKAPPNKGSSADNGDPGDPSHAHHKLNRPIVNEHTISLLVNAYFDHLAHLFPVISRSDFMAKSTPPPLLLYSICGIGATMREFPREMFAGIRGVINGMLRSNDILSDARIENVQALLVLAQVGDLHAQPTAATASASLMRTGSAIRMAQDLGLHRESHLRAQTPQDLCYVETRRRIWATCVIMDRWYGAALGIPLVVDLLDCDVLLPAGYEIILDQPPSTWPIEPAFVALTEHLKLSILVGRVLKTIYSPTGLKHATDDQLYSILNDMRAWKENLPEGLKFAGPDSSFAAGECVLDQANSGLLHLAYTTLHFLLWRPFMRITYICPPHLHFALETMHWSEMAGWATEALDWLNHNPSAMDTVFIYSYAATSCALVQYHTWVRRREPASLESLKQVRETALNWERAVQPDQMSIRRKTCETMTLLYEAALKTNPEDDRPPAINPTPGVQTRPALGKAKWVADPSKPYGGIWVAQDDEEKKDSGLTENSVVIQTHMADERPPPEMESTDPSVRARALSRMRSSENGVKPDVPAGEGSDGAQSVPGSYDDDRRMSLQDPQAVINPFAPPPSADPMQIFREMQMTGSNVNPQMNFGGLDFTGGVSHVGHGFNADPVTFTAYDPAVMDGLPVNGLNFDQWSTWFSNIDRLGPVIEDPSQGYQQPQESLGTQWAQGGGG